jgi:hypothetical protein
MQHDVQLGKQLHDIGRRVAVIGKNVTADAMAPRASDQRDAALSQQVARRLDMTPVAQLEGDMVHAAAR